MTSREVIKTILNGEPAERVGFWLGNPADDTKRMYALKLGLHAGNDDARDRSDSHLLATHSDEQDIELHSAFKSDLHWCSPELDANAYKHPDGKPMFDVYGGKERKSLNQPGVFADCESVKEVEAFDWPNPDYMDFTSTLNAIELARSKGMAVFSGMWTPFFHVLCDFFGMDNYFMKMYTHPAVVEAATERVLDFYLETNKRFFDIAGSKIDAYFFGNDLGSQLNLMISPSTFDQFILPGFKKSIALAKRYDLKVAVHSCGAVSSIIPKLIDIGVDALHPLQAKAEGMDAENLARQFKGHITFIGGVDTQDLLPFKSPDEVKTEVRRLKTLFGDQFIVSPSHEALLPNVSVENALAMRDATFE